MGVYRIFGRGSTSLGGMFNKPPDMPAPPNWLPYVMVDGAKAALDRVTSNGGRVC
jgi:predicted enzyme related to lactoylglutathione lyase